MPKAKKPRWQVTQLRRFTDRIEVVVHDNTHKLADVQMTYKNGLHEYTWAGFEGLRLSRNPFQRYPEIDQAILAYIEAHHCEK